METRIITKETERLFERHLFEAERSSSTIEKYMRDIRFFKDWLGERGIDKAAVLEYKHRLCEKYAPKSVNSILSSLNALFVFMDWHELKVKTLKIQRQIFADTDKELTKSEYERLLTAAKNKKNERLYYLMQTIASTGIRISELKYVTCEAVKIGQAVISCKGKMRVVFLPKQLCKLLKGYIKRQNIERGAVFVSRNKRPLDRSHIWRMMKSLCEAAGVSAKKVFPHNLRHLFARAFYSASKDIVRLADILGHSSINTTRIYTMETGEVHRRQIQRLGLLRC
ncbi:MAG: tyrosine-type recombinase/integrase [Clostridiales bacterium]|nr:tyrosine-type recombinase/integrase [Clostridiales bacterium]